MKSSNTSLSWIATSAAVTLAGGNVVFCDIEKDGFNIDYKYVEKKITSTLFYDTKLLPHPKKVIIQCLVLGAEYSQSQSEKENNKTVLLTIVPCFQENVGKIPISISAIFKLFIGIILTYLNDKKNTNNKWT